MINTYSIVFRPSTDGIAYVEGLKDMLEKRIGWFHSRNSEAHITVITFKIDESRLHLVKAILNGFCLSQATFTVHFDAFASYPAGTFFLAPDKSSKSLLVPLMKTLGTRFLRFRAEKVTDPHISIARELDGATLAITQEFFTSAKPDLSFQSDALYLRKYNADREQYDILENFAFGNEPNRTDDLPVQGELLFGFRHYSH